MKKKFDLFEFHQMFTEDILILYKGPFDKHILSVFNNYIEGIVVKYPHISKKVFSIFIELAQNIIEYSAEKDYIEYDKPTAIGTLVIGELPNNYAFYTGNLVRNEDIYSFIEKCEMINSLDREGLRKYRRELLNINEKTHVNLIQVALTSDSHMNFEVNPVNNEMSFFTINVNINKK